MQANILTETTLQMKGKNGEDKNHRKLKLWCLKSE